jgi:hypothetical protein
MPPLAPGRPGVTRSKYSQGPLPSSKAHHLEQTPKKPKETFALSAFPSLSWFALAVTVFSQNSVAVPIPVTIPLTRRIQMIMKEKRRVKCNDCSVFLDMDGFRWKSVKGTATLPS